MMKIDQDRNGTDARNAIRSRVVDGLERKGYSRDQMALQEIYRLQTGEGEITIPIEILVSVDGRPALLIKCIDGHISTREQAAVALARLIPQGPVPFSVEVNETDIAAIESDTRKTAGVGFSSIPSLSSIRLRFQNDPTPAAKPGDQEREKRILTTYYHLRCPVPKGPY
jgi:hypothetical protein